jgi:hypothetical protein
MAKWSTGTVLGVGIDLTLATPTIEFFFDGALVSAEPSLLLSDLGREVVVALSIECGEGQGCEINFGERPLRHRPPGYASVYDTLRRGFNRTLQIWDFDATAWRMIVSKDECTTHYWDDWADLVSREGSAELVQDVLTSQLDIAEELVQIKDRFGRPVIAIASASCRKVIAEFSLSACSSVLFLSPADTFNTCFPL